MSQTQLDKRIERLEKELKNAKAQKQGQARKERNGQLMAFGILLETKYKMLATEEKNKIKLWASDLLNGRNLERAMAGFARLDENSPSEISSEPPSYEA